METKTNNTDTDLTSFYENLDKITAELRANSDLKPTEYSELVCGLIFLKYVEHQNREPDSEY